MEQVDGAGLDRVVGEESRLVLALFHSHGCEPCRQILPQIEKVASSRSEVCRVLGVDADAHPDVVQRLGVAGFPTLVFFRDGQEIHRFLGGALPPSVDEFMRRSSDD